MVRDAGEIQHNVTNKQFFFITKPLLINYLLIMARSDKYVAFVMNYDINIYIYIVAYKLSYAH